MLSGAFTRDGIERSNPWLDLVRTTAIVLVLLRHGERALVPSGDMAEGVLQTIFVNGWVGVDLFLVLSGYLIACHLLKGGIGAPDYGLGRYFAMRALRIVPAYVAVIALVVAGAFPAFPVSTDNLAVKIGYHLLFLQDYLPSNINVVFWSLGVEEKFYLLAPLLMFALHRCKSDGQRTALLVGLFVLPGFIRACTYAQLTGPIDYEAFFRQFRSPFHVTLEGFVIGVAVAIAQHRTWITFSPNNALALFGCSLTGLLALLASHDFMSRIDAYDAILQPAVVALLAGGTVLGAAALRGVALRFRTPIRILAKLSYSLYLVHFPLIPSAMVVAATLGAEAFWPVYLLESLLAGALLYIAIERPFLIIKDRLRMRPSAIEPHPGAACQSVAPT